jgi:serine/threonine protein kinase
MGAGAICCDSGSAEIMPLKVSRTGSLPPILRQPEVKICEDDFEKINLIGQGGFAAVHLVRHLDSGVLCAMKVMSK